MNLSTPSANATIARATATATIIDNDARLGHAAGLDRRLRGRRGGGDGELRHHLRPAERRRRVDRLRHPGRHGARWQRLCGGVGNAQVRARRDRQDGQGLAGQRHAPRKPRDVQPGALGPCRRDHARSRRRRHHRRQRRCYAAAPASRTQRHPVAERERSGGDLARGRGHPDARSALPWRQSWTELERRWNRRLQRRRRIPTFCCRIRMAPLRSGKRTGPP